jgi:hypothetical protein
MPFPQYLKGGHILKIWNKSKILLPLEGRGNKNLAILKFRISIRTQSGYTLNITQKLKKVNLTNLLFKQKQRKIPCAF